MSKLNVSVGEDFPLNDAPKNETPDHPCAAHWRARRMHHRHRRYHGGPFAALFVLPAAAASVTAAILYPLTTLAVLGGLGTAGAIYRHTRANSNAKSEQK